MPNILTSQKTETIELCAKLDFVLGEISSVCFLSLCVTRHIRDKKLISCADQYLKVFGLT